MKQGLAWFLFTALIWGSTACDPGHVDVPDDVLAGLHKPALRSLRPQAVKVNGTGFHITISAETLEDSIYAIYINDQLAGSCETDYWRSTLRVKVPTAVVQTLMGSQTAETTCRVRISSIPEEYDISNDFDTYADYVSQPVTLQLHQGTTSFTQSRLLFPEWSHSSSPVLKCDSRGVLYLTWIERINNPYQVLFSHSQDNGETWSQVLNVSRSGNYVSNLDMAVDGQDRVFLTWNEYLPETPETSRSYTKLCRSENNGISWEGVTTLSTSSEQAILGDIDVDERGEVWVVWNAEETSQVRSLRLLHSRNHGTSWSRETLALPASISSENDPALASSPQGHHALITGGICFFSQDNGLTWNEEAIPADTRHLTTAFFNSQGQLLVAWGYSMYGGHVLFNSNSFLKRESDGAWGETKRLDGVIETVFPQTALTHGPGSVDVVLPANGDLALLRSHDNGDHWDIPEIMPSSTDTDSNDYNGTTIRHPSGKTYVVYVRYSTTQGSPYQLYLMHFE